MDIARLLQLAIDRGAYDLPLSGGNPPRVDGASRARPVSRRRRLRARRGRVASRELPQLRLQLEQLQRAGVEGLAAVRAAAESLRLRDVGATIRGAVGGGRPRASQSRLLAGGALVEGPVRARRTAPADAGARR